MHFKIKACYICAIWLSLYVTTLVMTIPISTIIIQSSEFSHSGNWSARLPRAVVSKGKVTKVCPSLTNTN